MGKRTLTYVLLALWATIYVWSFVSYSITAPTDFGFTRGLNRIGEFLGWQFAAGLVSVLALALSFEFRPRSLARWLVRLPFILALLLLFVILGIVGYAWLGNPASNDAGVPANPSAVTEPVDPVQ